MCYANIDREFYTIDMKGDADLVVMVEIIKDIAIFAICPRFR